MKKCTTKEVKSMTKLQGRKEEKEGRRDRSIRGNQSGYSKPGSTVWGFSSLGDSIPGNGLWRVSILTFIWGKEARTWLKT